MVRARRWAALLLAAAVVFASASSAAAMPVKVAGFSLISATRPSHHRVWVYGAWDCTAQEQVFPTGSSGGAPTPLPNDFGLSCSWVPGHHVRRATAPEL